MKFFSKRNKMKIFVCTNNLDRFYSDEQLVQFEDFIERLNIDVKEMECLSYCDECAQRPYVLINRKKMIDADSPEALVEKLTFLHSDQN